MGDYELYNGYLIARGINMPAQGVNESNIYDTIDAYKQEEPVYRAESWDAAKQWIDEQLPGTISGEDLEESLAEMIPMLSFMPEEGEPLPEYVAKELYPPEILEVMAPPVTDPGRAVAIDTARGYKEFLDGGPFTIEEKLDESSWGSENVGYDGSITYLPSGKSYVVFVHVFFEENDPTKDVVRFINIWEKHEEYPAPEVEIWEGDLDRNGGKEASDAIAKFESTGKAIDMGRIMIEGRTALYRGFLVIMHPYPKRGMSAYRNPDYYRSGTSSYEAAPGEDIATILDDSGDHGEFPMDTGVTTEVPIVDTCVGCGQEFPAEMLLYEGVEPIVFDPRCNICTLKHVQDIAGAENVILPREYWN